MKLVHEPMVKAEYLKNGLGRLSRWELFYFYVPLKNAHTHTDTYTRTSA